MTGRVKPGMTDPPGLDRRALVGGVVVQDPMDGQVWGDRGVQMLEKLVELLRPMAPVQGPHNLPCIVMESSEQARRPMPGVIVAPPVGGPGEEQHDGRHPVQGLDRRLLIDAEDHRALGAIQIEPDHVANLVHQERVRRELEGLRSVRWEPESPPDPTHGGWGQPQRADRGTGGVVIVSEHALTASPLNPGYLDPIARAGGKPARAIEITGVGGRLSARTLVSG